MQWLVPCTKSIKSDACFYGIGIAPWIILVVISTLKVFLRFSLGYNLIKLKSSLLAR